MVEVGRIAGLMVESLGAVWYTAIEVVVAAELDGVADTGMIDKTIMWSLVGSGDGCGYEMIGIGDTIIEPGEGGYQ